MIDSNAVVKNADMSNSMQEEAIRCAAHAISKHKLEKDIASHLKKEFDAKYSSNWHCIVGKSYGSYVTHETQCFVYFYYKEYAFLLFKSG